MTDKLIAAAKKAMQALEDFNRLSSPEHLHIYETITIPETLQALRQALAEPPKWVHLLTDEKADIRKSVDYNQFMSAEEYACKVQDATEAKLKELNHD